MPLQAALFYSLYFIYLFILTYSILFFEINVFVFVIN